MKCLLSTFTVSLSLVFLFTLTTLSQSQEDLCDTESIYNLLLEAQTELEDDNRDNASQLLNEALLALQALSENCAIEAKETPPPEPEADTRHTDDAVLTEPKDDGFYLVGIDIMPGRWESTGDGDSCYWERSDESGHTIDNHFGVAGGTVTIDETDFQVEFSDCGTFIYVENRESELSQDAYEPKESGFYTVGIEIGVGLWRSTGTGETCYYARLDAMQEVIDNHFGSSGVTINIQPTDYEVEFNDCGTWEYLGQP
jgi:hypothetical protein